MSKLSSPTQIGGISLTESVGVQLFWLTNVKRQNYKIAASFLQVRRAERGPRRRGARHCCDFLRVSRCQRKVSHTHKLSMKTMGMSAIRVDPSYITCNSYSSAAFIVPSLKLHIGSCTFLLHSECIMIFFPNESDLSCSSQQHNSPSWMRSTHASP